mmetsp:Transcript_20472/g.53795  ORF Transcript_20472/g.53795 Transcript_20472/m.53795 type:complete len:132 (-) Transcript_20472:3-398(-)
MRRQEAAQVCDDGAAARTELEAHRRPPAAQHGRVGGERINEQEGVVRRLVDVLIVGRAQVIEVWHRRGRERWQFGRHVEDPQLILNSMSGRGRPSRLCFTPMTAMGATRPTMRTRRPSNQSPKSIWGLVIA